MVITCIKKMRKRIHFIYFYRKRPPVAIRHINGGSAMLDLKVSEPIGSMGLP
jgi:hypothetical protein